MNNQTNFRMDYIVVQEDDLPYVIAERCPLVTVGDVRPFKTLFRYISMFDGPLAIDAEGDMVLIHPRRYRNKEKATVLRVLYRAKDKNAELQKFAKTSYERMCLDEDAEELDMLMEMCRKTVNPGTYVQEQPANEQVSPISAADMEEDEVAAFAETVIQETAKVGKDTQEAWYVLY